MRGQFKNKRDLNEADLFKEIRAHGIQVHPTDQPLDAVCGYKGHTFLVEIKNGPKAPFTKPQVKFLDAWEGQAVTLSTLEEATVWARNIRATYGVTQ